MMQRIRERLRSYTPKQLVCARTILAGVVMPLFEQNNEVFVVLTKRSEKVRLHKGEVSFPGGMYEEKDGDIMKTALRECCEEIGVKRRDVEIIGRIDDIHTITGFVVTPYVGIIPYPYEFTLNSEEVAYTILLPYRQVKETTPVFEEVLYNGTCYRGPAFYCNGERIWGATCKMLLLLKQIIEDEEV